MSGGQRSEIIHTLAEFENQLYIRFEKRRMDALSQKAEFLNRKQAVDEYISDYVDDMCQRAHGMRPRLEEDEIIQTIVDNSNARCQPLLITQTFQSLETLRHHADFLGTRVLSVPKIERKPALKPFVRFKPKVMQTFEIDGEVYEVEIDQSNNELATEIEASELDAEAIVRNSRVAENRPIRLTRSGLKPRSEPKISTRVAVEESHPQEEPVSIRPNTGVLGFDEFLCYGCGTPNVMRRNCVKCRNQPSKNGFTAL